MGAKVSVSTQQPIQIDDEEAKIALKKSKLEAKEALERKLGMSNVSQ